MAQEPNQPSPPATSQPPEYPPWADFIAVGISFAVIVGVILVISHLTPQVLLAVGLVMLLVELTLLIALTAVGWQGQVEGYPLLVVALGWLGWNTISGTCIAMYVWVYVWDISRTLTFTLSLIVALAPAVLSVALAMLLDKIRRWIVSRHVGRRRYELP
jgi:hypothetical protein